jgi:transposase
MLVADHTVVAAIVGPLLEARAVLRVQFGKLHRMLLDLVRSDPICRRLMSAPGVGPIVALTFRTCVDNPARFSRSKVLAPITGSPRAFINRVKSLGRDGSPAAGM